MFQVLDLTRLGVTLILRMGCQPVVSIQDESRTNLGEAGHWCMAQQGKWFAWLPLTALVALTLAGCSYKSYPLEYRSLIDRCATDNQFDPVVVAALIRNESYYQPSALSKQGAMGLMQIMPATGQWIATQMKVPYSDDMLWDPEYNISLGCWYLDNLSQQFNGDLVLILASYNAGRGNVKQWLDEERWTGEHATLGQIPFAETRSYVEQVMRDVHVYRWIYR